MDLTPALPMTLDDTDVPEVGAASTPEDERRLEAWEVCYGRLLRRTGRIPPELLATHVIEVTRGARFAVVAAALEAVERRVAFRRRDGLRVCERPSCGAPWGRYRVGRARGPRRPYRVLLRSAAPLRGSCTCPDFLRNGLGLCKHVLAVLEDLARRGELGSAVEEGPAPAGARPRVSWCPVRPLTGPGDWLEQVHLEAPRSGRLPRRWRAWVAEAFRASPGGWVLRTTYADDPGRRQALVQGLRRLAAAPGRSPRDGRLLPDPALALLLEDEGRRLADVLAREAWTPELVATLDTLRVPLHAYQRAGVERMLGQGRLLLADDMGLGKTAQAIAACHALFHGGRVRRGLLIVPASLKPQWEREWKLFSDTPVRVVDGSPAERERLYRSVHSGFLIVNYALVRRDAEALEAWGPELAVLDEAQRIKTWSTQTARAVKRLKPPWRFALSGTPLENRLGELASILEWVDDRALEPVWRLGPLHTWREDGRCDEVVGVTHLTTLRERVAPFVLRRTRDEVLDQLPARTNVAVPVPLGERQLGEHELLTPGILALTRIQERRPLRAEEHLRLMSLLTRQRVIANGMAQHAFEEVWPELEGAAPTPALLARLESPKLAVARDLLRRLVVDEGKRVVVFSQWRRMLRLVHWAIADVLEEAGLRAVSFTGGESTKRRTDNVVDFHDDPAARVLLATDAGGVGLNLQRAATVCVHLELPWNPAVLEQRIARIHRLGQTQPIEVYALYAPQSVEGRIVSGLSAKSTLFRALFEGSADAVRFDAPGFKGFLGQTVEAVEDEDEDEDEGCNEEGEASSAPAPSREGPASEGAGDVGPPAPPAGGEEVAPLRELDPDAQGSQEPACPPPGGRSGALPSSLDPEALRETFSRVRAVALPGGGLRLEAPPEAARTLATVFLELGALLGAAAQADAS